MAGGTDGTGDSRTDDDGAGPGHPGPGHGRARLLVGAAAGLALLGGGALLAAALLGGHQARTAQSLRPDAGASTHPGGSADKGTAARPGAGHRRFTLVATGDIIPYPSIIQQARDDAGGRGYDFRRILAGVRPVVHGADLAICHHEIPYGPPGGPFTGYPLFQAPQQLARAVKDTGYASCSTASNHTLDAGFQGLARTLDQLDLAGVRHTGSARTAAESRRPALLTAGGATVAQLSYTYGTNGIPLPDGKPWAVNVIDADRILADARAARRAGASVVVLSVHWGTEWQTAPDEQQRELARRLTAARTGGLPDLDLIIGTHNHVPQPYEKVNGTWVVYGMGDQVASFYEADKRRGNESSIPRFTFQPSAAHPGRFDVVKAEYLTQYSDMRGTFRVVCTSCAATTSTAAPADRREYAAVDARVTDAVLSRGAGGQGLLRATR
ncbi:CapA family protein [Streptomyces sp. NRRL S-87]|uniref:CapA family protein n=1 Tax=Streptomyces sp. NRRL S-87 TaxID=1463920 RepID=UPI00099D2093|nr:CapA family protein [Streptomyces sp. NRRL S-87]